MLAAAGSPGASPGCCLTSTYAAARSKCSRRSFSTAASGVPGRPAMSRCRPWPDDPKPWSTPFLPTASSACWRRAPRSGGSCWTTHRSTEFKRWLAQEGRVRFLFTPFYASWLNLVESWLRILRDRVIASSHYLTAVALGRALLAFAASGIDVPRPSVGVARGHTVVSERWPEEFP